MPKPATAASIDEYLRRFPPEVQAILRRLRRTIHERAPEATEKMAYGIPTFYLNGNLVHFGAFAKHIGFYPTASGVAAFEPELTAYSRSRGTIQFPIDEPLPLDLIRRIVDFRVAEVAGKATAPRKKRG